MGIFKSPGGEVKKAVSALKKLHDEKHAAISAKLKALDEGNGEEAVAADARIREVKLKIRAGESALRLARRSEVMASQGDLPKLREELRRAVQSGTEAASMYLFLCAAQLSAIGRADVAAKIEAALDPLYITSELVPDELANMRALGRRLAAEYLREHPLQDVRQMRQDLSHLEAITSGDGMALESDAKRLINAAMRESVSPEELQRRWDLERRAASV